MQIYIKDKTNLPHMWNLKMIYFNKKIKFINKTNNN